MAYEKQTWVTGEVITADKLNHMEDGIENVSSESAPFIITITENGGDKSFNEILQAKEDGKFIYVKDTNTLGDDAMYILVYRVGYYEGDDYLTFTYFVSDQGGLVRRFDYTVDTSGNYVLE